MESEAKLRKLLIVSIVVIVLLGGGIFIAPRLIDWNAYKGQISAQVEAATGRRLAIDGELKLEILPTPSLAAGGVRLSNVDGAASEDMVRLKAALIQVALGPLFRGRIEVDTVVLVEPRIELEKLSDGRTNWTLQPNGAVAAPATAPGEEGVAGLRLPPIRFDDIRVRDGTIIFRDAATGSVERIENINATLAAGSLEGPFRAEGNLEARGIELEFEAAIGQLAEDRAIPVSFSLSAGGGEAAFSGVLSGFPTEPRVNGRLSGSAPDPRAVLAAVAGGTTLPAFGRVATALDGNVVATRESISINDLSIRLGEGNATGAVSIALGEVPEANIVLNVGQIDLDAMLDRDGEESRGAPERDGSASDGGEDARSVVPGRRQAGGFVLPTGFAATLETKIDAILLNGSVIRQTQLSMDLRDGGLTISQAAAQLPGGSDIAVFGFVGQQQGAPAFDGQVEANSDNFRALLEWLNIDTTGVPPDRLRRFEMAAEIRATPAELTISGVDIQIDVTRVRGGVAVAPRQRPGFGIGFSIDRLNLDAYLPRDVADGADAEPSEEEPAAEEADRNDGAGIVAPLSFERLEILDRFDAILQLQIGSLTYRDATATGLSFDGTLQGGALELRNVGMTDFQGARLSASGSVAGLAEDPSVALDVNMNAADAAGILEFLGVESRVPVRQAVLSASLEGNLSKMDLDAKLETLGGSIRADGVLAALDDAPTYDLEVEVRHPSLGRLLQSFTDAPAEAAPDGFSVTAKLAGDLARAELDVVARVGPGSVSARGEIEEPATEPTAKFVLEAHHPDLTSLLRAFVPNYRPALDDMGEFRLTTQLAYAEQAVNVTALQGAIGPVALQGDAELSFAGERPRITAALSTSEIIADWFLAKPGAAGTGERAVPPGRTEAQDTRDTRRWSRDPINFTALSAFDADISLMTPALSYEGYTVEQPEIAINLEAGRLQVKQLAGRVFGGSFSMNAELTDGNVPNASMVLSITGADASRITQAAQAGRTVEQGSTELLGGVLELLFPVSSVRLSSGTLGADIALDTQGRNEFELVSNLGGGGQVNFTEAVVEGVDLCRLSRELDEMEGIESLLGLFASSQGGSTELADFSGRFDMERGVATLPQQRLSADCGNAVFGGTVDLPRWRVDMRANATFPEQPNFPGIVVEEKGSLDDPNVRLVNLNQIQQYVVGRAASTVIRRLLPVPEEDAPAPSEGTTGEAPSAATPPEEPPAKAPSLDPFKLILEGLIR